MTSSIYLASRSPRRAQLLHQLGVSFAVCPADIDETPAGGQSPLDYARAIARRKAEVVAAQYRDRPVLGADTDVSLDGRILGKPDHAQAAIAMLQALSGREHEVYSAVAVVCGQRCETAVSLTRVRMAALDTERIEAYVRSGEPMDKAGAYAIQGRAGAFVTHISGSYSGVVGLPLHETAELLRRFGVTVP